MTKLGITYNELLEIYAAQGHQVKQPNSVKAITQALNLMAERVWAICEKRFAAQQAMIDALEVKLMELQAKPQTNVARVSTGHGRYCYCGTLLSGEGACPVCYARA